MFVNLKIFVGIFIIYTHVAQSGSVGGTNKQNKNKKN